MSKALVIKGANFAANKVETITLSQVIPCTGISIAPSTVAFDTLGATQQLTPTLTPVDTTEVVYYVSSNENVVTVSDTGLITSVGVGSATITVTCGQQSATVSVTSSDIVVLNDAYSVLPGYRYSGSIDLNANPPKNHVGITAVANAETFYSAQNVLDGYRAFVGGSGDIDALVANKYPIPIPSGANQMTIIVPSTVIAGAYRTRFAFINANEKQTYIGGDDGNAALGIGAGASYNTDPYVVDLTQYNGANSFILSVTDNGGSTPDNIGNVTVKFE